MDISVLGSLEVRLEDSPVSLSAGHQRTLLACLALSPNRAVSRDRLIEALWGEQAPASAANALQVQVHGLRRLLGERVETEGPGYRLRVEPGELDLERFESLSARGRDALERGNPAAASRLLNEALDLWRGPALDGIDCDSVATEAARLDEQRIAALEDRLEAELALGRHASLVAELERLVREHPVRERIRGQLILALYRSGRQVEALEAYREARRALVEELGMEPSPELQALERAILRQDPAAAAPERAAHSVSLPRPLTAFVGRELELAAVGALARRPDVRLLTLTGPGGTGKTRLAIEAASSLADEFPGGVTFVPLAPLSDPQLVPSAVANALGADESPDESLLQTLATHLGNSEALLVLDNFEQVADAAVFVSELLAAAPGLTALVTSRGPLRISGEHEYSVPPLPRHDAVELFAARARAVRSDFEVVPQNAEAVSEICYALDGLPLALELAAARIRLLAPEELLVRLEDRLSLLVEGPRDAPERQQTLRRTLEWSYDLLSEDDRRLFARLAVFRGGWTLAAARAVCEADETRVDGLLAAGLVTRREEVAGEARFAMLETVRSFALERFEASGEAEDVRRSHALWFAELAEESEQKLKGEGQREWLARMDADHDNMRAALDAGLRTTEVQEPVLRLATALGWYWYAHGHAVEGAHWLDQVLPWAGGAVPKLLRARALHVRGILATLANEGTRATELFEQALELFRELGDHRRVGNALNSLAAVAINDGDYERARALFEESIVLRRETGDIEYLADPLCNLGSLELYRGNLAAARSNFEESLAIDRERGNERAIAIDLGNLASVALAEGDLEEAERLQCQSLRALHEVGDRFTLLEALERSAAIAVARGDNALAGRLVGAAAHHRERLGHPIADWEAELLNRMLAPAQEELGNSAAAGAALALDEAVELALAALG